MNVVGIVGSLISQGVYSVATPFHPFGGAVDIIVVEQQDGTYRSTPWYVRFGKFQGVLKGAEKIVKISVNGVESGFHMYLDNSGEAYFIREVVSGKDGETNEVILNSDASKVTREDSKLDVIIDDECDDNIGSLLQHESGNGQEVQCSDENAPLSTDQVEFQDEQSSQGESIHSSGYGAYRYDSLDHVEDVVESQGSDIEVILVSVDGHVLTAPISSAEQNTDYVQLRTPQFHLGPGEGADFNGSNEEFETGVDDWAANCLSDIDTSSNTGGSEGGLPLCNDGNSSVIVSEVCADNGELVTQNQETPKINNIESDLAMYGNSDDAANSMSRNEIFKSCLEFSELTVHVDHEDVQDKRPPCMESEVKVDTESSQEHYPCSLPVGEETEAGNELQCISSTGLPLPDCVSSCNNMSSSLSIEIEATENNALMPDNSDCISVHSVNNDPGWKDEQCVVAPEAEGVQSSPGRPTEEHCNKSEMVEPQLVSSCEGIQSNGGMGFEISLCGNLLRAGMGLGPAAEAFVAHRISKEEFEASASLITKNESLIVRYKDSYLPWDKAAPITLGAAAFGLDLPVEPKDVIPVEQDDITKPRVSTQEVTSTPSGRRWRLWPIPFRRVKTLQHTSNNSSNEEVFVDSESGSHNPHVEPTTASNGGSESPHKQLIRTNVPTTEQIASLNLKEGQNMIAFSFSTRVLGTQQVDAHIYLWRWNTRIVISDVDGTITKSDVLGQFMPLVGKDWTQSGVARLFSAIKENGYQLLFLSARAIVQAYLTRSFLLNLKQDGKALPKGPVVISPDGLFPSLYREVIRRAPHEFKIACLEDIRALFPSDYNPFYAGFGNRDTDELSYRKIGIPKGKIFIINPKGEVAISHRIDVKSYTSLHTLVNDMFPPTSLVEQEDFNSWNYWRMPLPNVEL